MKIQVEKYGLNSVDSIRVFNKYFVIIKCFVMKKYAQEIQFLDIHIF